MEGKAPKLASTRHWPGVIAFVGIGAALSYGGVSLIALGGSPYYLIAGLALLTCAVLLFLRRTRIGFALYGLFLCATLAWAVWEVGSDPWGLFARVGAPLILALLFALPWLFRRLGALRFFLGSAVLAVSAAIFLAAGGSASSAQNGTVAALSAAPPQWSTYAGDLAGTRFSLLAQITPANVSGLKQAWVYRTGDLPGPADAATAWTMEATPIQAGNRLYLCTSHSQVHAIEADTGKRLWKYDPKPRLDWVPLRACRGVALHVQGAAPKGSCHARIISPTVDGLLIALDADTGQPCRDFGREGVVDLKRDLGMVRPGYYYVSSAPLIIGDRIIVGGSVLDGGETGEPSGVIRAYDAVTGKLDWNWDAAGRGDAQGNGLYTRGTPNAWAPLTADPGLGLVYIPLGNPTPDFFGALRTPEMEKFGTSFIALDLATGKLRWSFQTVHHDLWDQDNPAQPSLFELRLPQGNVPALVLPTKSGQLFVLDRRSGKPLRSVEERPVPQAAASGDAASPTQPFSTGMPSLLGATLREASSWGMTPIDQMICRIRFRQLRYQGPFTPPSVQGSLSYPGSAGIFSWGGVTLDLRRGLLIANSVHSPFVTRLIPRRVADGMGLSTPPNSEGSSEASKGSAEKASGAKAGLPQVGTPYAAQALPFLSPLGVPCIAPPWGRLTAISLNSGKVVWQRNFGTSRHTGPLGMQVGLPLPIGVPSAGGSVALDSGVTFIGAAQDRFLRAFSTETGKELWRTPLPAGGQATPMSFYSPAAKRQYIVIATGGHGGLATRPGDYVIAYRLP